MTSLTVGELTDKHVGCVIETQWGGVNILGGFKHETQGHFAGSTRVEYDPGGWIWRSASTPCTVTPVSEFEGTLPARRQGSKPTPAVVDAPDIGTYEAQPTLFGGAE